MSLRVVNPFVATSSKDSVVSRTSHTSEIEFSNINFSCTFVHEQSSTAAASFWSYYAGIEDD